MTPELTKAVEEALNARELIKVSVLKNVPDLIKIKRLQGGLSQHEMPDVYRIKGSPHNSNLHTLSSSIFLYLKHTKRTEMMYPILIEPWNISKEYTRRMIFILLSVQIPCTAMLRPLLTSSRSSWDDIRIRVDRQLYENEAFPKKQKMTRGCDVL